MRYQPLHCWDCGDQVIAGERGSHTPLPHLRQVKFILSDGSYCESPFCATCAAQPWTAARCQAFKAAVDAVSSHFRPLQIISVEGNAPLQEPILGILDAETADQLNRLRRSA